jgi:hypothetical protein
VELGSHRPLSDDSWIASSLVKYHRASVVDPDSVWIDAVGIVVEPTVLSELWAETPLATLERVEAD